MTVLTSGVTNGDGLWSFTGLAEGAKDVRVVANGQTKWYKGKTQHSAGTIFFEEPVKFGHIAAPSAPGAATSWMFFGLDGKPYYRSGAAGATTRILDDTAVPGAAVYHNANQTITHGVSTFLSFNSEHYDTDTIHDTSTNNGRLTCKTAGVYLFYASVRWAANTTGTRVLETLKNGTSVLTQDNRNAATAFATGVSISKTVSLAVNDYLEARVYQDSGGDLAVVASNGTTVQQSCDFGMVRISA